MQKLKHHKLQSANLSKLLKIGAAVILLGGSSGIVFGLTASLSNRQNFINIRPWLFKNEDSISPTVAADYRSLPNESYWNCDDEEPITNNNSNNVYRDVYINTSQIDTSTDSFTIDPNISNSDLYAYGVSIIDGSSHVALDKSFNQSIYWGLVNWVHQKDSTLGSSQWKVGDPVRIPINQLIEPLQNEYQEGKYYARISKPAADDNNGFTDVYRAEVTKIKNSSRQKGSLLLAGYLHETPLASFETRYNDLYESATYTLLDGSYRSRRCASVFYKSDQSAFLSALAACQYLQDRYDTVYSKVNNGKLAVGTYGGLPIPTVTAYMGGFQWGVYIYNNYILPKLAEKEQWDETTREKRTVGLISIGKSDSFYSNSFVTGESRLLVQQLLMQGADAILPVSGPQTMDVVNEIRNQGSPAIAIGVDTDQENGDMSVYTSKSHLNYGDKIIQFSAQKDLAGVSSIIFQAKAKAIRGYYFSQNDTNEIQCNYLGYDGMALASQPDEVRRSFIGNSGYVTVGSVYNKCSTLSQGASNVLTDNEHYSDNPLFQGTGWESLYDAIELLTSVEDHPEQWNSYDDIISFLLQKKFVNNEDGTEQMDVFQFLDENKYFIYE